MAEIIHFSSSAPLLEKMRANKSGELAGICSICSSNPYVIRAALRMHCFSEDTILIESTCNQVNQEGGYTGYTPSKFAAFIQRLAVETSFPPERIILGGDHLGPNPWKDEPAESAMKKAERMVHDYVLAGFSKIHLDASMTCAHKKQLSTEEIAERSAQLCRRAEQTAASRDHGRKPVYVIGTEVPTPGGLAEQKTNSVHITQVRDVEETIQTFQEIFRQHQLETAWQRVIAVVVSAGVEFNSQQIFAYDPSKTRGLRRFIEKQPNLVFEAHSTDYQSPHNLRNMIGDYFAVLKVGPALTFAFREAMLRLAEIEKAMPAIRPASRSRLVEILLEAMRAHPVHWCSHYSGTTEEIDFSLLYSLSDRVRYYWEYPSVKSAVKTLLRNLQRNKIPLALISQYFHLPIASLAEDAHGSQPVEMIDTCIQEVLSNYQSALGT